MPRRAPHLRVLHDPGKAQLHVVRHMLQQQRDRHAGVGGGRERVQHDRRRARRRRLATVGLPGRPRPRARLQLPLPRCMRAHTLVEDDDVPSWLLWPSRALNTRTQGGLRPAIECAASRPASCPVTLSPHSPRP